jgi:uncharacterized protein
MSQDQRFSLELKSVSTDEPGVFEGALSTYGNTDLVGEVCQQGCFTKSLKESGGVVPLFLNHDHTQQVGILKLTDTPSALEARGKFNLDLAAAKAAYSNLKFNVQHGIKSGLSIGFRTIKDRVEGPVRHLIELALKEGSLTLFPANQMALVNAVKSEVDRRNEENVLALIQELRQSFRSYISEADRRKKEFGL